MGINRDCWYCWFLHFINLIPKLRLSILDFSVRQKKNSIHFWTRFFVFVRQKRKIDNLILSSQKRSWRGVKRRVLWPFSSKIYPNRLSMRIGTGCKKWSRGFRVSFTRLLGKYVLTRGRPADLTIRPESLLSTTRSGHLRIPSVCELSPRSRRDAGEILLTELNSMFEEHKCIGFAER